MKKQVRLVLSAVLALSLVGAFAMFGCSSNTTTTEKKDDTAKTEQAEPVELQVFAANSLSKAMEDIQKAYIEDGHGNVTFKDTQYKSSGELNEMLGAGSYADLLISASKGSMDTAVSKGYVDESTRVDMFKNDLVMVSKEGAEMKDVTLQDIADGKYTICVGDDSVPAGNYAAQSLSTVGVYAPAGDDEGKTGKDITGKGGSYNTDMVKDTRSFRTPPSATSASMRSPATSTSRSCTPPMCIASAACRSSAPFRPIPTRTSCTPAPSPRTARTLRRPRNSWIGA